MGRIFSLLSVSLLYFIIVSFYSNPIFIDNFTSTQTNTETEHYCSLVTNNLLCHTSEIESSNTIFNNTLPTTLKNNFNKFSNCIHSTEQAYFNTFSQYNFYAQNLLVRLQQTDIIFPFHYFW